MNILVSNDLNLLTLIIQAIIFAIASLLHGITGLAFPMIGTISLSITFSLPKAIIMMAIPSMIMNLIVLFSSNENGFIKEISFYAKNYWLLIITSIIGSVIGIQLLLIMPIGIMYLLMSSVTLMYVVNKFLGDKQVIRLFKFSTGAISTILFGFSAGIIGGSTNAMSPILMMYLFSKTTNKNEIVKSSNICYFFGKVVQIYMLGNYMDKPNNEELLLIPCITVISIIFLFFGINLRNKVSNHFFKNAIYIILLLLSIKVGYSGVQALNLSTYFL